MAYGKKSAGALVARQVAEIPQLAAARSSVQQMRSLEQRMLDQYAQAPIVQTGFRPYPIVDADPHYYQEPGYAELAPRPIQSLDGLSAEVARLRDELLRVQGGPVYRADYDHGVSAYAAPQDVSKGGILQSEPMTIPALSAIGFSNSSVVGGLALARLTGTMWVYCAVATSGILADPEEAAKIEITADINGARVNNIFNTPLDAMIPNLMGNPAMIPVRAIVPSDSQVTFTATVINAAMGAGTDGTMTFRLYAGNSEQWAHFLGGGA